MLDGNLHALTQYERRIEAVEILHEQAQDVATSRVMDVINELRLIVLELETMGIDEATDMVLEEVSHQI